MPDLIDIVAPLPPPPATLPMAWLIAAAIGIALIIVGVGVWRWHRRRARRHALRQLRRVERALAMQTIDARTAAFAAAETLRHAYRLPRIMREHSPQMRWHTLIDDLDQLRYAPPAQHTPIPANLLREVRYWIRRAPC